MSATKILWGQVLLVSAVALAFLWAATEWTAWKLGFQPQLGHSWFELFGWPVYQPPALLWWWFAYDAYARPIFVEGAYIAASGGIAAIVVAITMSVWRAREVKKVTTYGSARWAETREVRRAGLLHSDGVLLGRWRGAYLRHDGPEHVLCFAPTRSGKGVGLVVPTLLTWPGSAIIHDIKGENWTLTAGWRARFGRVLLFDPTNAESSAYNPLLEVRRGDVLCRQVNDAAAELAAASGGRLVGMATVPLADPKLAARELLRAHRELGLSGVEIGTSIGEMMLDHPSLDAFYDVAEELGATVLLHPYVYMLGLRTVPGFERFFLQNNIGNMLETHIAAARLLLGGVFDRHPRLRVQLSHGGGGLTYQLARLDHTYRLREQVREVAERPPSEYLGNLLFDTVLYDPRPVRFLIDLVGPSNVVFGTDHPFDIADTTALEAARALDDDAAAMVLEGNAARAYALD